VKNANGKSSVKKSDLPEKNCIVCSRPFVWRKKWEKVWDEVKYCSERCRGEKSATIFSPKTLSVEDTDRVVRMAWEDRTPFAAIQSQFGLSEAQTIEVMQRSLAPARFRSWRKRVHEHGNLKDKDARGFEVGPFKSRMQRMDGSTKKYK
jgi:uncharacterized protein (TIGR03643 family)